VKDPLESWWDWATIGLKTHRDFKMSIKRTFAFIYGFHHPLGS
jgi:hypothetical protein